MRFAAKVDRNHQEIVKALRAVGASVQSLAAIGKGCPDLLVGYRGRNILIEVKDGDRPPSERKLTEHQLDWITYWNGAPVAIVTNVTEVLNLLRINDGSTP